ncbi:MAG: aminomethyl-transferring glycine dehydrogenase subunit GcvPA [Anaerolineae bacterium]|nr:MAG: aminomethyl-transferring glycine dehydrogenase subunit GcvPA [Anaerolineae bacterium]
MTYIPHTEAERSQMLTAIGVKSLDELYAGLPAAMRFPDLALPEPASEMEVMEDLQLLSEANLHVRQASCFLGAGAYNHYVPSVVDHVLLRNEFYTAYTPYQPEVSQGTLQAIFEFQSLITFLTGMEVANASHYDGATSLAEAAILSLNHHRGKRTKIVVSPGIHPQYREVLRTYLQGQQLAIVGDESLKHDQVIHIDENTSMVAVQYPDFFGNIHDLEALGQEARQAGALLCVVANPIALGMLKPPSEFGADIVVGEGQPLGIPLSFGGPYIGFFATRDEYVRKIAGRLVGETVDSRGQRGYVMTLTPREQHIRRGRATSNICTNQGLMALAVAAYLSTVGRAGLKQVAELCYHKAHYAAQAIDQLDGYQLWNRDPFFHEFVVRCSRPVAEINEVLLDHDIIGGYDLGQVYPELAEHMLIAVTELNYKEEIDDFVEVLNEQA